METQIQNDNQIGSVLNLLARVHYALVCLARKPLACAVIISKNLAIAERLCAEVKRESIRCSEHTADGELAKFVIREGSRGEIEYVPYDLAAHGTHAVQVCKICDEEGYNTFAREFESRDIFHDFQKLPESCFNGSTIEAALLIPLVEAGLIK